MNYSKYALFFLGSLLILSETFAQDRHAQINGEGQAVYSYKAPWSLFGSSTIEGFYVLDDSDKCYFRTQTFSGPRSYDTPRREVESKFCNYHRVLKILNVAGSSGNNVICRGFHRVFDPDNRDSKLTLILEVSDFCSFRVNYQYMNWDHLIQYRFPTLEDTLSYFEGNPEMQERVRSAYAKFHWVSEKEAEQERNKALSATRQRF